MSKDPNAIQLPLLCRVLSPPLLQLPSRYSAPLIENPPSKSPDIKLTVIVVAACSISQLLCLMNFAVCDISEQNCSKYRCSPGSCQPTSQNLWPHLNFTLKHYNYQNYGITISWEQPGDYIHDESNSQATTRCSMAPVLGAYIHYLAMVVMSANLLKGVKKC